MRQSRSPQFRFRMVLLTLFALIVSIVSFTWHLYQRQLLQVALGDRIRFHEARRLLHLLRADGSELVEAALGAAIPADLNPHQCGAARTICEEWKYRARLLVDFSHGRNLSCYGVRWEGLAGGAVLRDCVALRGAHWYGMGLQGRPRWPLRATPGEGVAHPLVTGDGIDHMFGGVVDRYWLSSLGVALFADDEAPLYVTMDGEHLCLEARGDRDFPYRRTDPVRLEYTLCTGRDMRTLHQAVLLQHRPLAVAPGAEAFLEAPVWTTGGRPLDQGSLQDTANRVMELGLPAPGFLLLDGRWQSQGGSLEFDASAFPSPREILQILRHKGFRVLLAVHPYVCLPSPSFLESAEGGHLLTDEWKFVPLLTRFDSKVCGLLDLTSNATSAWFLERLLRLRRQYDIDGFVFSGGQTAHLPRHYAFSAPSVNPDAFLRHYLSLAPRLNHSLLGTEVGFQTQDFPGFVRLTARTASWDGLSSVIPEVLTLGLLGYPLVSPGSVGGGGDGEVPPRELYLRWLELAVFLPVLQFSGVPDAQDAGALRGLLRVREELVLPAFRRALAEFPDSGAPLVRPLWWIAPGDGFAQACDSQFLVGGEVMVAPVLEEGRRSRDVYLPAGWWKDHLLGEVRRGGKWLHNYPVPLAKVAYFSATEKPKVVQ